MSDFTLTLSTFSSKYDIAMIGKNEKNHQVALLLKNVEKTYKSSDYSTTFTASRVAWVAKEPDNAKELACSFFCAKI